MSAGFRTRIAPTPSGFLHAGNAYSFLLTWVIARKSGGHLLLRIDDLDASRKRPEYVDDIFRTLEWLGLEMDDGPTGPDDLEQNWSQSHRLDRYEQTLQSLRRSSQVFACECSRASIQRTPERRHPVACRLRHLSLQQPGVAWRVQTASRPCQWRDIDGCSRCIRVHESMRDFVVRRRDGLPAYQVASLVDDVDFGIDLMVRGEDLLASTAAQRWLATILDESAFLRVRSLHHQLLKGSGGRKLSKSTRATDSLTLREQYGTAQQLLRTLSPHFGLAEPVATTAELLANTSLSFMTGE